HTQPGLGHVGGDSLPDTGERACFVAWPRHAENSVQPFLPIGDYAVELALRSAHRGQFASVPAPVQTAANTLDPCQGLGHNVGRSSQGIAKAHRSLPIVLTGRLSPAALR